MESGLQSIPCPPPSTDPAYMYPHVLAPAAPHLPGFFIGTVQLATVKKGPCDSASAGGYELVISILDYGFWWTKRAVFRLARQDCSSV